MTHDVMNSAGGIDLGEVIAEKLAVRWSDVGNKIVAMAEDFPSEQYDRKPTPEVRSMAEQLRHIAFWNVWVLETLEGKQPDGDANELAPTTYATKTRIVKALEESFTRVATEIRKGANVTDPGVLDTLVSFIEHNGEHYGQLVMWYRVAGMVPPISR